MVVGTATTVVADMHAQASIVSRALASIAILSRARLELLHLELARRLPPTDVGATRLVRVRVRGRARVKG